MDMFTFLKINKMTHRKDGGFINVGEKNEIP